MNQGHVGEHWVYLSLDRHPNVATKIASRLDRQRAVASNPTTVKEFIRLVQQTISNYKTPPNIWNIDEKGFMLGQAKKSRGVMRKSRRSPRIRHVNNREWITDIEAINAAGEAVPPFVILKGKSYHIVGWHAGVQPDEEVRFAFSPKGWSADALGLT